MSAAIRNTMLPHGVLQKTLIQAGINSRSMRIANAVRYGLRKIAST